MTTPRWKTESKSLVGGFQRILAAYLQYYYLYKERVHVKPILHWKQRHQTLPSHNLHIQSHWLQKNSWCISWSLQTWTVLLLLTEERYRSFYSGPSLLHLMKNNNPTLESQVINMKMLSSDRFMILPKGLFCSLAFSALLFWRKA